MFNRIINKFGTPLAFINDLIQFFTYVVAFIFWIILIFNNSYLNNVILYLVNLNLPIKLIVIACLLLLIYYYFRKMYRQALFIASQSIFEYRKKELVTQVCSIDYKILPPLTPLLNTVFREMKLRTEKWSYDVKLCDYYLEVRYDVNKTIDTTVRARFFSKRKKSCVDLTSKNFKMDPDTLIRADQITHYNNMVTIDKPFFESHQNWKTFFIECLERLDYEIAGRNLYIVLHSWDKQYIRFYIDAYFTPNKLYSFFLKDNNVYEEIFGEPIFSI